MPVANLKPASVPAEGAVVTKATLNAAERLGLTSKALAEVIGVSEATVSRMRSGSYTLAPGQKAFELALLLARLYRSLDAITGGDDRVAAAWLRSRNTVLDAEPIEAIRTVPGLMHVIEYLDARRAVG
jgi:transcriptional regulator with XRE-family HTH domain